MTLGFIFVVVSKLLIKNGMDIKLSIMVPSIYGNDLFEENSLAQDPCADLCSRVNHSALLEL